MGNLSVCCQLPGGFVTSRRPEEAARKWTGLGGIQTDAGDHIWVSDTSDSYKSFVSSTEREREKAIACFLCM